MSPSVPERLHELAADVRDLEVRPAAEIRARGRRRGRRRAAGSLAAGTAVVAVVGLAFAGTHRRAAPPGPAGGAGIACVVALPDDPSEVRIRVFADGAPPARVDEVAAQFRARRFVVVEGATGHDPAAAATLHYGPATVGRAAVVRAMVHGDVAMRFDPGRADATVDLGLGAAFTRLNTTIEVQESLVAAGPPAAPPGC